MQPRKRTQFVRFQILTEFSSESCAELCQVFCLRVMSSIFKSAVYIRNGSELCQVFSTSYVKYFVCELCQVFDVSIGSGSYGTVTCACYVTRVYTCVLRLRLKPSTQPMGICVWESRDLLVYIECSLNRSVLIGYHSVSKGFSSFGLIWRYFMR